MESIDKMEDPSAAEAMNSADVLAVPSAPPAQEGLLKSPSVVESGETSVILGSVPKVEAGREVALLPTPASRPTAVPAQVVYMMPPHAAASVKAEPETQAER